MEYQAKVQVKKLSMVGKVFCVTFRFLETETVCDVRFDKLLMPNSNPKLNNFDRIAESAFADFPLSKEQFAFLSQHSKESFIVTLDITKSDTEIAVNGPYPIKKLELIYG